MKTTIASVCVLIILTFSYCAELPPSFKKCNIKQSDFKKCLSNAVQNAIQQLKDPIPKLGLHSIDPFWMETLTMEVGNASEGLHQIWSNVTVYGLSKPVATDASWTSGSVITLDLEVSYDRTLVFASNYEAHGAVLLLPVDVFSSFRCEFVKGGKIKVTYKIQKPKKGNGYFKLISTEVVLEPKRAKYIFTKVFENQNLTDALNSEMYKNWEGAWKFIHGFLNVYDPFFDALLRSILEKVPADQIIDGLD
ncbi:uncharacterized protein LOC135138889 [Zophobas morio]|uniref:uncharacterized protein LOC135138889 n=1 Tax=Zophobas morio TaxID=2755281 RepID=UPI003082B64F